MRRNVTLICKQGGHKVALDYARVLDSQGFPLLVNFANMESYPQATEAEHLVNERTGALIFIISTDLFPGASKTSRSGEESAALRRAIAKLSVNPSFKLFLVVIDDEAEGLVKSTWINQHQWLRNSAQTREAILNASQEPFDSNPLQHEMSSFKNVESIISDLEPASSVERIANVRVSNEHISYEIFRCKHRIRTDGEITYYIHLHRWITISNTAKHLIEHYPAEAAAKSKMIVLNIEKGHVRPSERLANVGMAFQCSSVEYLETLVSRLIENTANSAHVAGARAAPRTFVEPQVCEGRGQPPRDYHVIKEWLGGPQSGALILMGQGGIGKTWAMLNLRERITTAGITFSRQIDRKIIFISSTDVTGGLARSTFQGAGITLYDLYVASHAAGSSEGSASSPLPRDIFYNALELGTLVVFVDGLDEVVTRYRSQFDAIHFFNDLTARLSGESDGKVVISCRTLFFDQEDFRLSPGIRVFELLAFDAHRRDEFLSEAFPGLPRKLEKAAALSERLAVSSEGRYVPFVLDLIKDVIRKEADGGGQEAIEQFHSGILILTDVNDRIVGQFCRREIGKTPDPMRALSVDQQVTIFSRLARGVEAAHGGIRPEVFEEMLSQCLAKKEVRAYIDQFLNHPFISQSTYEESGLVDFRFDFMPEYFLMLDAVGRLRSNTPLDADDVRIFTKLCALNTPFCRGINNRLALEDTEFYLMLIQMNEQVASLISRDFLPEDSEILRPDSAAAKFSYAMVSLLAAHEARNQPLQKEQFTNGLKQVFGDDRSLKGVVLLDGFVHDEERVRIDFRDLRVEDSLFRAVDIWNCDYNVESVFSRCRFINCSGSFASSSGMNHATFDSSCQLDDVFEHTYAHGRKRVSNTHEQNIDSIKSFVEDFYKQAHFRQISYDNIERYYGKSNSVIPFKKLYNLMKIHGIVEERNKGNYTQISIAKSAMVAAEQLITQNWLSGPLEKIAIELRNAAL